MKHLIPNRKNLLFAALLASAFGLNAQIESTHTDEKFGYTTVVYKDKAATDSDVLAALENSIGMGDVVRVTVAPPKPAVVPKVDKSKVEDTVLKPTTVQANAGVLTASVTRAPMKTTAPAMASPNTNIASVPPINTTPVAPKPVVKKVAATPAPVVIEVPQQENAQVETNSVALAPRTVKTKAAGSSSASKSANKSLKKSKSSFKAKSRKQGKQRYKCPTF